MAGERKIDDDREKVFKIVQLNFLSVGRELASHYYVS